MTAFVRVRAQTPPDCTVVAETPAVCMLVAERTSVCTDVAETPLDRNRGAGTPPLLQNKLSGLMTRSEKETLVVAGSNHTRYFLILRHNLIVRDRQRRRPLCLKDTSWCNTPPNVTAHFDSGSVTRF